MLQKILDIASPQRTPEFRAEAVRIALTSGLPRKQVVADLGVGFSTPNNWTHQDRGHPAKPTAQTDMEKELAENSVTLEDLSGQYNVSRERIRQIEVRAFEKLQKKMRDLAKAKGMLAGA